MLIKEGDAVGVSLLAANRDPVLGEDLGTFDPEREPTRHLAFGWGMHRCVGAEPGADGACALPCRCSPSASRTSPWPPTSPTSTSARLSAVYGVEALPVLLDGDRAPVSA
ncbi:hypothetical protein [Nocardioides convexus]|uniref:hypothetical protein n=1 Tax=Nocardioides convexus TaxID=2712224 RepID=UPI0024182349|nr:hypothetical protein [Nocardioides convexus]